MATPLNGRTFTFTQPDGSPIQLRGWGDQNYAVFETLDGYTVTKNPATGYYEVAQLSTDGNNLQPAAAAGDPLDGAAAGVPPRLRVRRESALAAGRRSALRVSARRCDQRREERRQQARMIRAAAAAGGPLLAPPQRQTVGDFVGLCLLIDFSDSPATIPRDEIDRFCNQPGYNGFGNHGSVFDFFNDNSIGRCRYKNIVAPYYRALHPKTFYTNRLIPQPQRALELINEALTHFKANGFDFSPLTADNQGFVYALNVYYAGPVTNNWSEGLWPHSSSLNTPFALVPGKSAYDYQFTAMGAEPTLGTFCHENGHMLCDYPDLYDYGNESSGVGLYCLMCAGNFTEKNPLPISAYLKRLSGWARNVTPIAHGSQLTLTAGSNDFAIYSRGGREYFLIENRQKAGRDVTLPDEGLAIWHVDEDGDNSHEEMTGSSHYELSLVQADGLFQLERQPNQLGDAGDLYAGQGARFADNALPNSKWWSGLSSDLIIDQISPAGASVSFRCLLSDTVNPPQVLSRSSTPNRAIPDNNTAGISDTINMAEALTLSSVKVSVDITHTYRGDLRVMLTTPWNTAVELHPKGQGGNAHDLKVTYDETTLPALATLRGRSLQGTWRLTVQDLASADVGQLNKWSLEFSTAAATGVVPIELKESPGAAIPDSPSPGIERTLLATGTAKVGSVEVSVDISHTYIGDLRVSLLSPAGMEVVLHDGAGGSDDNLVRTFTVATTAALSALAGQPAAGPWRLKVVDREAQDVGKLNAWRVVIKPMP